MNSITLVVRINSCRVPAAMISCYPQATLYEEVTTKRPTRNGWAVLFIDSIVEHALSWRRNEEEGDRNDNNGEAHIGQQRAIHNA